MIDIKELRIGNYLHYNSDLYVECDKAINLKDLRIVERFPERFTPIPITTDWLEENKIGIQFTLNTSLGISLINEMLLIELLGVTEHPFIITDAFYIHELQNKFYWLSTNRTELEIND